MKNDTKQGSRLGADLVQSLDLGKDASWPLAAVLQLIYSFALISYVTSSNPLPSLRRLFPDWKWKFVSPSKPFTGDAHPDLVNANYVLVVHEGLIAISRPGFRHRFIASIDPDTEEDSELLALLPKAPYDFIQIEL